MKKKNMVDLMKKIVIICIAVIVMEVLIMLIMMISRERKIDRVNMLNDIVKTSDGYVAVGVSDFHNSKSVLEKTYEYTYTVDNTKQNMIVTQSRIAKYDKDNNLVWENTYDNKYDSTFYSLIEVEDGYMAVGSLVSNYEQIDLKVRDGLIVKFDKNGKMLWDKTYTVLDNTEFYKIIKDDGNYVVVGKSIYENYRMGTHITGGGIIVRYDKEGNVLAHNNYGGNKSGSFSDVIKVDDGYIVCGKDATNYGIVVKYKKDFDRDEKDLNLISNKVMWQRTYSNTDNTGFTSIAKVDNKLYVVGAINVSNEKDDDGNTKFKYDAGMVIYDINGKYLGKFNIEEDTHHMFNSVVATDDNLYLSMLLDVDSDTSKSGILKYSIKENKIVEKNLYNEDNNYIIKKILNDDGRHLYVGTSKNKCTIYGCDYENVLDYYENK